MPQRGPIEIYLDRLRSTDRRRYVRPISTAETLDFAARVFQENIGKALPRTFLPVFYSFLSLVFIRTFLWPALFPSSLYHTQQSEMAIPAIVLGIFCAAPLFVYGLATSLSEAISVSAPAITGENPSDRPPVNPGRMVLPLLYSLFVGLLPVWIAVAISIMIRNVVQIGGRQDIGFILGIIAVPAWFAAVFLTPAILYRYTLIAPLMVIERLTPVQSVRRSRSLLGPHSGVASAFSQVFASWFTIGMLILFIWLGLILVTQMFGLADFGSRMFANGVWGGIVDSGMAMLPGFLILWIFAPYWGAIMTLIYYDRRSRIEAYDIRLLAEDVMNADRKNIML